MNKVLLVATVVRMHVNVFHIPMLKWFKEHNWQTYVVAKNDYLIKKDCVIPYCDTYIDLPFERFPLKPTNFSVYKELKNIIDKEKFDLIYCHTPVGGLLGRLAAKNSKNCKVLYMAHGFHFYQGAPFVNWLFYYPVEKLMSKFTDVLITINKEDYDLAKRKMKARKTYLIPGVGIELSKFQRNDEIRLSLRKKLHIDDQQLVLLSVGELSKRKNHQIIIRTLPYLPSYVHYYICGSGQLESKLLDLASSLDVKDRVHLLGFRSDVAMLYNMADIFAFPSIQEGLPVSVMEAMANGLPIVCSKIRGNTDLVEGNKGGFLVEDSISEYIECLEKLITDSELRKAMGRFNKRMMSNYSQENVLRQMSQIIEALDRS